MRSGSNYASSAKVLRPEDIRKVLLEAGFEGEIYDELHELTDDAVDALHDLGY